MMRRSIPWLVLLASAVLEAVWATALGLSEGFSRPLPIVVFALTATLSLLGLGWAVRTIPLGTAYAIWVGIGAALTVSWAMATGVEPFSPLKLLFIGGIVGCAAGLKALPSPSLERKPEAPPSAGEPVHLQPPRSLTRCERNSGTVFTRGE